MAYLEQQFRAIGLKPGNPDGSYIQKVPLVGITPDGKSSLVFARGSARRTLTWSDDFVAWTKHVAEVATLDQSEVVFVGYGVEAPGFTWDDYKGMDVAGKTLIMLVNDPPLADTTQFGGRAMTYYGRGEGVDFIGQPADFGMKKRNEFTVNDYHKPSDEIKPGWDLSGAVLDLKLFLTIGYRVAQAATYPAWRPGNEFRAIREARLKTP